MMAGKIPAFFLPVPGQSTKEVAAGSALTEENIMQYAKPVTLNVEECDRLSFLPYLFGNDFLYAEAYVYALAQKMMPEYQGGFWHFIRLPDGGGYMMPDGDRFHLVNGENWFDRTVSADAAGIILTSLVINRQLWLYHDSGDDRAEATGTDTEAEDRGNSACPQPENHHQCHHATKMEGEKAEAGGESGSGGRAGGKKSAGQTGAVHLSEPAHTG